MSIRETPEDFYRQKQRLESFTETFSTAPMEVLHRMPVFYMHAGVCEKSCFSPLEDKQKYTIFAWRKWNAHQHVLAVTDAGNLQDQLNIKYESNKRCIKQAHLSSAKAISVGQKNEHMACRNMETGNLMHEYQAGLGLSWINKYDPIMSQSLWGIP